MIEAGRERLLLVQLLLALLVLFAGIRPGLAQVTPQRAARAKEMNKLGIKAVDDGDFAGALDMFRKAYELNPLPKYLFNVGRGLQVMGRGRAALDVYRRYLGLKIKPKKRKRTLGIIKELEGRMGRLTVKTDPSEATLRVDGNPDLCVLGKECLLDPGKHVIAVTAPKRVKVERKVSLEPAEERTEKILLPWTRAALSERVTRGSVVWRSALFPGIGQSYAGRKGLGWTFTISEGVALATAAVGFSLKGWYESKRDAQTNDLDAWHDWDGYAGTAGWVAWGGLAAGGLIWLGNLAHALAMPLNKSERNPASIRWQRGLPALYLRW